MADILLNSIEGGSGGSLIMPKNIIEGSFISIKTGSSTVRTSTSSSFYSELEANFASQSKGFDVDTLSTISGSSEQTITDIIGEGVLTNVLSPNANVSSSTITIKVTVDGVEYVFSQSSPSSTNKLLVGDFWVGGMSSASGTDSIGTFNDKGFAISNLIDTGILNPQQVLNRGICGMIFKESLKVTIQSSVSFGAGFTSNKACAFYTTYIPEGLK